MAVVNSVLDLIGETPIVKLSKFDTGPCDLFLKLESENPGGSIKDRIAVNMIEAAEREGKIQPGGTIIVNTNSFEKRDLDLAGYDVSPLEDGSLADFQPMLIADFPAGAFKAREPWRSPKNTWRELSNCSLRYGRVESEARSRETQAP